MLEINEEIPFLWRLSSDKEEGFSHVSMVIPFHAGSENLEHTIPTDVISFLGENDQLEDEEILEWNEDDIALFLKLLATRQAQAETAPAPAGGQAGKVVVDDAAGDATPAIREQAGGAGESTHTFRVDLSDPETIEIVHIVAAAGFGMAMTVDDLLVTDPGDAQANQAEPDVGARITLHTVDGYKRGVVVGMEEEEVVCVLLDGIRPEAEDDNLSDIHAHDLVIVKAHQLLPARYSSQEPGVSDVLH